MNRQLSLTILFFFAAIVFQRCKPSQVANTPMLSSGEPVISYEEHIQPIMKASCTPCHFPDGGRQRFFDTYAKAKNNVRNIVLRVELPVDADGYMPFKSKKEAFTPDQIEMIKTWAKQGFPE